MDNIATKSMRALPASSSTIDLTAFSPVTRDTGRSMRIATLLRRHRVPVIVVFIVCMAAAAALTSLQTPLFRAKTRLEVEGRNPDFLNTKDLEPTGANRSAESFMATQTMLIRTETLAERVVKRTHLAENAAFFRQSPAKIALLRFLHLSAPTQPVTESEIVQQLLARINVKPEGDSDLIAITVDTPDAKLSAELANRLSSEYMSSEQEERWDSAVRIGKWLTEQLDDFRLRLQQSEDELQHYAQGAGLLFTADDRNNVADDKLRQIQQDLSRAQADRAEKQSQIEMISSAPLESLPHVVDDGPMRDLTVRLADLRTQDADLSATLTPTHYKVQRVRAEILAVENELTRRRNTVVSRIRNEYEAAVKKGSLLQASYASQARVVTEQNAKAARYNVLKREVETNSQLYSSMLQKVKEASVLQALKTDSVRIVDPAKVPDRRYRPSRVQNFGVGLLAFGMISVLLVIIRERADRNIRDPGEAARMQFRELGVIPSARHDPQVRLAFNGKSGNPRFGQVDSLKSLLDGQNVVSPEGFDMRLVTRTHSRSVLADAFRSAAMSIARSSDPGGAAKVVVFSSPHKEAGKSTTAANVAIAIADGKRQVLLIDGDLRRPQVHALFGVPKGPGLFEALNDGAPVNTLDLAKLTQHASVSGLSIITAGDAGDVDPMILGSERFGLFLARLRLDYDMILVDAPPLMHLPDARLIAKHTDGMVLVVRAGKTSLDQVADASRTLQSDGTTALGVILTDWDPRSTAPGYYRSYYSGYATAPLRAS